MILVFALGCTPLVGAWDGAMTCGDVDELVSFDLAWGENQYVGAGALRYTAPTVAGDQPVHVAFDVEVESAVDSDGGLHVDATSTTCTVGDGADALVFDCTDDLDADNDFLWDHGRTITVAGGCAGTLTLQ